MDRTDYTSAMRELARHDSHDCEIGDLVADAIAIGIVICFLAFGYGVFS